MNFEAKTSLWRNSLLEFRNRVAAGSPTPGGGAVAAVAATFAAALLRMACAISLQRQPNARMAAVIAEIDACEEKLAGYADEDVRAFERYIAARRDQSNIHPLLLRCAQVPLEAAEQVAKLQNLATEVAVNSPAFLASDISTARHLLHASRQSLLDNVTINLAEMKDCEEKLFLKERLAVLLQAPGVVQEKNDPPVVQ